MATCASARATLPATEALLPIEVRGDLRLDGPSGGVVRLSGDGTGLRLDVPRWKDLTGLGPQSLLARRRIIISTARRLTMLGLSLDVAVQGRQLFRLGGNVRSSWLSRLLGLGPVYLPVSALLTAWRR